MPLLPFITLILAVMIAGGITVWLISLGGQTALLVALPVFLIASAALKLLRK